VAVAESLAIHDPGLKFNFVTSVPVSSFDSLAERSYYHRLDCDVGLVQTDALTPDLPATLRRLASFLPFDPKFVQHLADQLLDWNCCAVISDIAPLGIEIARVAGLPSVLIENFTWDWIYRGYADRYPRMAEYADYLASFMSIPDLHLQCQPVCRPVASAVPIAPVSRTNWEGPERIRKQLGIEIGRKMVLISMGGTGHKLPFLDTLCRQWSAIDFVIAGQTERLSGLENIKVLSGDNGLRHPDLVRAADAVIGKAGYSTIAEVYRAGVPFGYFSRSGNPETPALLSFLSAHAQGIHFEASAYSNGTWVDQLPTLLEMKKANRSQQIDGANQCAVSIIRLLNNAT
jgi:hypothetical protein